MRPIDANELKSWLNGFIETDNISPTYMRTLIDTRPTVEAIPIEWIEQYGKKQANKCCHCATAIWELLEDWEKENESNVSN